METLLRVQHGQEAHPRTQRMDSPALESVSLEPVAIAANEGEEPKTVGNRPR